MLLFHLNSFPSNSADSYQCLWNLSNDITKSMTTICSSCGDLLWSHLEIRLDPLRTVRSGERKASAIIQKVPRLGGTVSSHWRTRSLPQALCMWVWWWGPLLVSLYSLRFLSLCFIKNNLSLTLNHRLTFKELVLNNRVCYRNISAPYEKDPSFCVTPFFKLSFCTYGRHQCDC